MRHPITRSLRWLLVLAGAAAVGSPSFADDRDLLYSQKAATPNVMVIISNSTTMRNIPATTTIDPLGQSDGPNSKMGIAKSALNNIIKNNPGFNWGLSSFSYTAANFLGGGTKHFIFQPSSDTFSGQAYNRPAGTKVNFGGAGYTTVKYGTTTYAKVTWVAPTTVNGIAYDPTSSPLTDTDTLHLPFNGKDGQTPMLIIGAGGNPLYEMVLKITSPNTAPYAITTTGSIKISEDLYSCAAAAPCDPTSLTPIDKNDRETWVIPPEYCREDNSACYYPQIFGYGADVGKEIGWASAPTASNLGSSTGDWSKSSGNASGWLTQAVSDPQPITMIPRDYTPWTPYPGSIPTAAQQSYVESSTPCLVRALRPSASTVHYSSANAYTNTDDFPHWDPNTGLPGGNMTACDRMVDGYYQAGKCLTCTNSSQALAYPVFTTINGNVAPLQGILKTDAYRYFNGVTSGGCSASKAVDMFCGGSRVDDPFGGCRHDYIILLTDSFVQQSAITKSDVAGLTSIGVRVFVIGFGVNSGDVGPTNYCTLFDGTLGNAGKCIADWTGATTYNPDKTVKQEGYFTANDPSGLVSVLNSILNELNESNRDFATATIPSVSSTSEGVGYLSEFQPQNNHSIWRGHLRAFYLDPVTGLLQTSGYPDYKPSLVQFQFGSGSTQPTGSLVWEAGNPDPTSGATVPTGILNSSASGFTDPNTILTAGTAWSDAVHDQATIGGIGRNVFFGVKPGDAGCGSTTYQCLFQMPVGVGGSTTEPFAVTTPPSPLPGWWTTVRDGAAYANVPNPLIIQSGSEAANNRDQALQNSFSFLRGNRDPVVENLKISGKFDATHTHCSDLSGDPDSPCYYGDILGDIFHSNPVVVSFPNNVRYYFAQDPGAGSFGTYADRGGTCTFAGNSIPCSSYQLFFLQHAHRRKILYAGGDDGLMHAFDIGVYNGDASSYTPTGQTTAIQPFLNHYDLGSGREIFGYAPGAGLNKAYQLGHTLTQDWTIDGPANADDVYMDVANVGGTPRGIAPSGTGGDLSGTNPKWRTVLVGIEREGGLVAAGGGISSGVGGNGGSVFAMDVTDPDQETHMHQDDGGGHTGSPECLVNSFVPGTDSPASGCDAAYPRILWEVRDDQVTSATTPQPAELSTSAEATTQDLGMTWSRPVLGRVKLNVSSGTPRDFFVAIFGGGYDHTAASISAANTSGNTGNYLYMVDIETGKIIYKKNLGLWNSGASGSNTTGNLTAGLPGEPAVIDLNGDGYLDRIYIGDTQGRLWKVDLTTSATMNGSNMVQSTDWNPTLMFDEFQTAAPPLGSIRQPIFTRPSVFLVSTSTSGTPRLGVAFGTGDRDNMPILADTNSNWFVVVVDDPTVTYPVYLSTMTQASLTANPSPCTATNCMNANGYYLVLNQPSGTGGAQIVNTNSLAFNQAIYFNTFLRTTTPGNCNQLGEAFLYKINYLTGESLYTDVNGNPVANEQAGGGAEVASDPIVYEDVNSWVVSATDTTSVQNVGGGTPPAVNIKSWKEQ